MADIFIVKIIFSDQLEHAFSRFSSTAGSYFDTCVNVELTILMVLFQIHFLILGMF